MKPTLAAREKLTDHHADEAVGDRLTHTGENKGHGGHHPVNSATWLTPVPVRVADGEVLVTVTETRT